MSSSVIITRLSNGVQVSGPDGFEPIVFEQTLNAMTEVRKRINYIEEGGRESEKIIPFPVEQMKVREIEVK
jgi:hypothetical protein